MAYASVPGDTRFFERAGPFTLAHVAKVAGGQAGAVAEGAEKLLSGVAPLQVAGPDHVTFLDNRRYAAALAASRAAAVIVHPAMVEHVPTDCVAIVTDAPYLGWARVALLFHPTAPPRPGVHPTAAIDTGVDIDPSAEIGPFVAIGAGARIGPRCRIAPGAVIGAGVVLGADCRVGANASLEYALLGERVYVYPGARIGQEGFGFATGPAGFVTVPQLGRVIIGDDVEVGANTTIDRGSAQDTVVGSGTRIDNLVQVGHNVRIGRCCVIVAQVALAGSVVIDDFVQIGGQAAVAGHLHVGAGARIGAQAGVIKDVAPGIQVVGSPAIPARDKFRQIAAVRKLADQWGNAKGAEKG